MALPPAFRGRGLGTRLLDSTVPAARKPGVTGVEPQLLASRALALYEQRGFVLPVQQQEAREPGGAPVDVLPMSLRVL